jgi:acetylornithine aminotransferase
MLDEVQSGTGRTGTWFAFQHSGVKPDVVTLAKGLGNGVPIGTCLAAGAAAGLFTQGKHGSTFGGNPLACAAGLETLAIIEADGLMRNAVEIGDFIRESLRARLAGTAGVREIRGVGLMIGIELTVPCGDLVTQALEAGLLINVTADTVVRLLPPLIYTRDEAKLLIDMLVPLITTFLAQQSASRTPAPAAQSA